MEYYFESEEQRNRFIELFPTTTNARIMELFGISLFTVERFRREFGLIKNMHVIRRQQALNAPLAYTYSGCCKSARTSKSSEAATESLRRKWAEGFNPMLICKQNNPQKFRAALRTMAQKRRELFRKEKARVLYGLPQRTNLRIKLNPLSKKAMGQKYCMIRDCNYFPDPEHTSWVCFDRETKRSPRREATALRHGLKIINADETNNSNGETHITAIHSEARSYF